MIAVLAFEPEKTMSATDVFRGKNRWNSTYYEFFIFTGDFGVDPALSTCPCYYYLVNSFLVLIMNILHAFVLCVNTQVKRSDEYKIKMQIYGSPPPIPFPKITAAVSVVYSGYSHSFHG